MPSLLDVHVPTIFILVFLVRKSKPPSWLSQLDSIDFIFFWLEKGQILGEKNKQTRDSQK